MKGISLHNERQQEKTISSLRKVVSKKTIKAISKAKGKNDNIGEEEKYHKGKRQYFASITMGLPQPRKPSKGMVKRKVIELMVTRKEERESSEVKLDIPILKIVKRQVESKMKIFPSS